MQRQSLGSASTKTKNLPLHKDHDLSHDYLRHNHPLPSSSSSSLSIKEEELKKLNPNPKTNNSSNAESYIHLIPTLTLLCFLILYLSSHTPSQNDLAHFNGFKNLHVPSDSGGESSSSNGGMEEVEGSVGIINGKGELLRIGSLKHRRLHRKIIARF